jgi:hypothetical protein
MKHSARILLASATLLASQQANAILMATQGDAPETDPALSTAVDDTAASSSTVRQISNFDVAKITGASAGLEVSQTTQSNLFYVPLGFTLNRGSGSILELNLKLSYASENDVVTTNGGGISDTVLGLSYYVRSSDTVIRSNFSIKFPTGEFNDQLTNDATDYIVSLFARKSMGDFAIRGNAGYVMRGEGQNTQWGDSYILKAGAEMNVSKAALIGADVTYTDTEESTGSFALIGITTSDFAIFADYQIDAASGFYARVSSPVSEDVTTGTAPDRDTTVSFGFSTRY